MVDEDHVAVKKLTADGRSITASPKQSLNGLCCSVWRQLPPDCKGYLPVAFVARHKFGDAMMERRKSYSRESGLKAMLIRLQYLAVIGRIAVPYLSSSSNVSWRTELGQLLRAVKTHFKLGVSEWRIAVPSHRAIGRAPVNNEIRRSGGRRR